MDNDRELLVHLAGYATIAVVLATAEWAAFGAFVYVIPIVFGALGLAVYLATQRIVSRARESVSNSQGIADPDQAMADGGPEK